MNNINTKEEYSSPEEFYRDTQNNNLRKSLEMLPTNSQINNSNLLNSNLLKEDIYQNNLWHDEVPYIERKSLLETLKEKDFKNIKQYFPPVKPNVKLNTKHIFCFLIYMIVQSFFLFLMVAITGHYIFNLVNIFTTTITAVVVWSKISYISNKKEVVNVV